MVVGSPTGPTTIIVQLRLLCGMWLEDDSIAVGGDFLDRDQVSCPRAKPLEEFPDPAAPTKEPFCAIKVSHGDSSTAPVDDNLALGSRRAVRPTDHIGGKLVEEAPQIDVVVIDVSLSDFGRANGTRTVLT